MKQKKFSPIKGGLPLPWNIPFRVSDLVEEELKKHYSKLGKLGRQAVNNKYTPEQLKKKLSEWGKKGGRPPAKLST